MRRKTPCSAFDADESNEPQAKRPRVSEWKEEDNLHQWQQQQQLCDDDLLDELRKADQLAEKTSCRLDAEKHATTQHNESQTTSPRVGEGKEEKKQALDASLAPPPPPPLPTPVSWAETKKARERAIFFSRPKLPLEGGPPGCLLYDLTGPESCFRSLFQQDPTGGLYKRRQRTEWWFAERLNKLTGSKLVNALGFFGLDDMLRVWYETYDPTNPDFLARRAAEVASCPEQHELEQERMAWGTFHEVDALATFCFHLGQELRVTVEETTLTTIRLPPAMMRIVRSAVLEQNPGREWVPERDEKIWNEMLATSPDGNIRSVPAAPDGSSRGRRVLIRKLEDKAPYKLREPKPYDECIWYYYPQNQMHILSDPDADACYFQSWSPSTTKVWQVMRDYVFWNDALPLLVFFHDRGLKKQPPTSIFEPERVERLKAYCRKQCRLVKSVGEFRSVWSVHRAADLERMDEERAARASADGQPTSASSSPVTI